MLNLFFQKQICQQDNGQWWASGWTNGGPVGTYWAWFCPNTPWSVWKITFFSSAFLCCFIYLSFYFKVYQSLQSEGYNVAYERVPVTDEKSPKERDFDLLVSFKFHSPLWTFAVNYDFSGPKFESSRRVSCSSIQLSNGKGKNNDWDGCGNPSSPAKNFNLLYGSRSFIWLPPITDYFYGLSYWTQDSSKFETEEHPELSDTEESLRRGEYKVIRSLTRVLEVKLSNFILF